MLQWKYLKNNCQGNPGLTRRSTIIPRLNETSSARRITFLSRTSSINGIQCLYSGRSLKIASGYNDQTLINGRKHPMISITFWYRGWRNAVIKIRRGRRFHRRGRLKGELIAKESRIWEDASGRRSGYCCRPRFNGCFLISFLLSIL